MAELKSSSERGIEAEKLVLQDLKKRTGQVLGVRVLTPFAEVDIVFQNAKNEIILFEVKSLSNWDWINTRIGQKQKQRLKRAAEFIQAHFHNQSVILWAAYVVKNKIYYLKID